MIYSKDALSLTEKFEGCVLTAYKDITGVLTIGYGHTGSDVYEGKTITKQQAEDLLTEDVIWAEQCVIKNVKIELTQHEFDALVDFVFNLGCGNFMKSTLLRLLNQGDIIGAANEFELWDKAGGKVVAGLFYRRQAEKSEFLEV